MFKKEKLLFFKNNCFYENAIIEIKNSSFSFQKVFNDFLLSFNFKNRPANKYFINKNINFS